MWQRGRWDRNRKFVSSGVNVIFLVTQIFSSDVNVTFLVTQICSSDVNAQEAEMLLLKHPKSTLSAPAVLLASDS